MNEYTCLPSGHVVDNIFTLYYNLPVVFLCMTVQESIWVTGNWRLNHGEH